MKESFHALRIILCHGRYFRIWHYTNIATVSGQFEVLTLSDEDLDEYYGHKPDTDDWEPHTNPLIPAFVLSIFMILMLGKEKR